MYEDCAVLSIDWSKTLKLLDAESLISWLYRRKRLRIKSLIGFWMCTVEELHAKTKWQSSNYRFSTIIKLRSVYVLNYENYYLLILSISCSAVHDVNSYPCRIAEIIMTRYRYLIASRWIVKGHYSYCEIKYTYFIR